VDSKSGLYKAKTYGQARQYKPKPYDITKNKAYKLKEYQPKPVNYQKHRPYESKTYDYYYEYNPDYKEADDKPKTKRNKTTAPSRAGSRTPIPSSPNIQVFIE